INELTRGPFLKCKDYDPNFITLVPHDLCLPPIESYNFENKAEGIVIRPLKNIEVKQIGRVMLKIKTEDFDERTRRAPDFIILRNVGIWERNFCCCQKRIKRRLATCFMKRVKKWSKMSFLVQNM